MRAPTVMKHEDTPREPDRAPRAWTLLWGLLATALVVGIVLYFLYERGIASVL